MIKPVTCYVGIDPDRRLIRTGIQEFGVRRLEKEYNFLRDLRRIYEKIGEICIIEYSMMVTRYGRDTVRDFFRNEEIGGREYAVPNETLLDLLGVDIRIEIEESLTC